VKIKFDNQITQSNTPSCEFYLMVLELEALFVGNYMTAYPISVLPEVSLPECISFMAKRGIGNLIVSTEEGDPLGVLTERDILKQIVEKNTLPNIDLKKILLTPFEMVSPNTSIQSAAELIISKKARLLVFTDSNKLVGIITPSDLLRAFRKTYVAPILDDVISKKVYHVGYNDSIFDACKLMYEKRVGSVIVDGKNSEFGIFTERDLVFKVLNNRVNLDEAINLYSSFPLITAPDILANEAANIMAQHHIKRLVLRDQEKISGIVTVRDIIDAYQSKSPQIRNY